VNRKTPRKYYLDEKLLKEIGDKIRHYRELKSMSIEALANDMDSNYSQINRMELGKVNFSISYLSRVAKALEVDPKKLLP
jgi:transcriptional regulator with XRE-family HTH domain